MKLVAPAEAILTSRPPRHRCAGAADADADADADMPASSGTPRQEQELVSLSSTSSAAHTQSKRARALLVIEALCKAPALRSILRALLQARYVCECVFM